MQKLPLGPFDVTEPVGRGGMGSVWKGVHRDSGVPVAVKVLHRPQARETSPSQSFRNEIRAVAGLDHPGVVWVFDTGVVAADAVAASDGVLRSGSPWLAMEYASGRTLSDHTLRTWAEVRALLLDLLSALGHAHARGVVHRDLKPGNVLWCDLSDIRPGWKLTDFGIAAALEETVDRSIANGIVGTLAYMSPEQIRSDWRDFGPWTDLYALGCIVYRVLGQQRPFREVRGPALITAHLTQRPQRLVPKVPVPALFAEWVDTLMQKLPRDRFQSAAEASRMLLALGPEIPLRSDLLPQPLGADPEPNDGAFDDSTEVSRVRAASDPRTVLPPDWRTDEVPWPAPRLLGAGLGLAGLRAIPMVGRQAERDVVWGVLRDVAQGGRARVVVVRGAAGVGKTRVARWAGETAHERGGLPFLIGEARPDEPPHEVLARPFRRWFRTVRLGVSERTSRLKGALALADDDQLLELASTLLGTEGETGPILDGEARHAVARRLLERLAGRRPAVLVLDDAHHSADAVRFARHLVDAQAVRPTPVLLILVVSEEAAAADPHLYQALTDLLERPGVRSLRLDPLPASECARLVQGLLPLERSLAASLGERTGGNPLHAVELVRSWVSTGRLARGEGGFELVEGGVEVAPMRAVWSARVDEVLEGLSEAAARLLEVAAALGSPVDEEEWQRVCDDPRATFAVTGEALVIPEHVALREELRSRLLGAHLAEEADTGWAFVHEMLREAVLDRSRAAGRLHSLHRACARGLLHRPDARLQAERIGRHLLLGGRGEQAIAHLLEGYHRRRRRSGDSAALPVLGLVEEALTEAGAPAGDPRWVELAVRRAETFARLERADDAARWGRRAAEAAAAGDQRLLESRALVAVARASMLSGLAEAADDLLARAERLVRDDDDRRWLGELQAVRAQCARSLGDVQRSRGHSVLAARYLAEAGERAGTAQAWAVLAESAEFEGSLPESERAWERARGHFARDGRGDREADCLLALGRLARRRGDLERSADLLARAVGRYRESGSPKADHAVLALALVHLARREWDAARRLAGQVVTGSDTARLGPFEASIHGVLVCAAAGAREWPEFDGHLEQIRRSVHGPLGEDLSWCLELAAARALAGREPARAAAADALRGQVSDRSWNS